MTNVKNIHIMSSVIVNGQLQPRLLAFLGYGALATITANRAARDRDDKEAEESKEKIRDYRHRRGQLYSSFRDQFMIKFKILDAVVSVQCFKCLVIV